MELILLNQYDPNTFSKKTVRGQTSFMPKSAMLLLFKALYCAILFSQCHPVIREFDSNNGANGKKNVTYKNINWRVSSYSAIMLTR